MPEFLTKLVVTKVGKYKGRGLWQLNTPLVYSSKILGRTISVPKDFITDFASVPRLPFTWWYAGGLADRAAVVHDYLYNRKVVERKIADKIFLEAMKASGISLWHRYAMYAAVRALGWRHYGKGKVIVDVGSN